MSITEIVLIIAGGIVLLLGYFLPSKHKDEQREGYNQIDEEQIRETVGRELDSAKSQINDAVEESVTYSVDKAERSMERISNEKIMSVNEYSDTVLDAIKNNHEAVIFLYDMMNEKHDQLVKVAADTARSSKEMEEKVKDAEILLQEIIEQKLKEAEKQIENQIQEQTKSLVDTQIRIQLEKQIAILEATTKRSQIKKAEEKKQSASEIEEEKCSKSKPMEKAVQNQSMQNNIFDSDRSEEISFFADENLAVKSKEINNTQSEAEEKHINHNYQGNNNKERILELHKKGKSKTAIARDLGLGVGEVKLVIDLFEGN